MANITNKFQIVPFLKWAGGKRWLISKYPEIFPKNFNRYIEPFLGGGAVFFYLSPKSSILSDINEELIDTYRAIKEHPEEIIKGLQEYQQRHSNNFYYAIRNKQFVAKIDRAIRFLYLNRTCWNGLYRVNQKGEFNVPIGTKETVILDTDNFILISKILERVDLRVSDFSETINEAKRGDFIFVDPPYTVKHNNNGFVKYNEKIFSWEDQEKLAALLEKASNKGVKFLLTNADHCDVIDLYRNFSVIDSVKRSNVLAGKKEYRGKYNEAIIRNY